MNKIITGCQKQAFRWNLLGQSSSPVHWLQTPHMLNCFNLYAHLTDGRVLKIMLCIVPSLILLCRFGINISHLQVFQEPLYFQVNLDHQKDQEDPKKGKQDWVSISMYTLLKPKTIWQPLKSNMENQATLQSVKTNNLHIAMWEWEWECDNNVLQCPNLPFYLVYQVFQEFQVDQLDLRLPVDTNKKTEYHEYMAA